MKQALLGAGNGIRFALVVAAISLLGNLPATATNLFWSGNGTTQGGAGTWNTSVARFGTAAGGPYGNIWNNANVDSAEFGNVAGQVNIGGSLTVNTITTDIPLFNIGNLNAAGAANTIVFSGAGAGVNTNYAGGTTTISAVMNGTVIKSGAGRMELGNANNPTSIRYVLNGGALTSASMARISSAAPGSAVANFITFDGGGWAINSGNQDTGANRGITIKAGGAFFGSASTTVNLTISSPIVGTAGGDLTVTNAGPFTGNAGANAGGILTLNNTGNSWNGNTIIGPSSTIRLGLADVIPNASNVTLSGGTLDLNSFSETVGVVTLNSSSSTIIPTSGTPVLTATSYDMRASGTVSAVLGGAGAATKTTGGVVTLTAANTFAGGFNLNAGTVRAGNVAALGPAGNAVSIGASTPTLASNNASGRNLNYAYSVGGDFTLGDATGTGVVTMSGTVNLGGATRQITVDNATDTISGVISNGGITKAGTGILVLSNTNTYSGPTTINAGQISIQASGSTLGDGTGTLFLAGGKLNSTANRTITSDPVANPINLTADSAITTSSSAATVNLAFTTNSVSGAAGKTLTFRNEGANDATDLFKPRFMGSGFDFQNDMVIDNGTTGKTELDFANTGATSQTFSGKISGTGSVNRTSGAVGSGNGGDTILTGNNTYSGGTTIEEGKLFANNTTGSATGSGPVTVGATGTLAGNGSVSGPVTVNGTVSPGASIESLGTGSLTFGATGVFKYEMNTTLVTADLLNATAGSLSIGAGASLAMSDLAPGFINGGTKFTMVSYNGTWDGGTFAGAPNLGFVAVGAKTFRIRYADTIAGGNFAGETALNTTGRFVTLTAVPELSSLVIMGLVGCFAIGAVWVGKRYKFNAFNL